MNLTEINAAVENYDLSPQQKKLLKVIASFTQGVTISKIASLAGLTKESVEYTAHKLVSRGMITREKDRVYVYKVNPAKLSEIIEFYKQQLRLKQYLSSEENTD